MSVPDSCDSPDSPSHKALELEQPISVTRHAWLKELRFWLSALFGFALMIGYKSLFPTQSTLVDVCAAIVASLLVTLMAGFPVTKTVIVIIKNSLEHLNY
jgi:hypothetical protein